MDGLKIKRTFQQEINGGQLKEAWHFLQSGILYPGFRYARLVFNFKKSQGFRDVVD